MVGVDVILYSFCASILSFKINSYFGSSFIKNIHVKIINTKFKGSLKNQTTKINKKSFINNLKKVENINLKNKLEKLIKAYNEKN